MSKPKYRFDITDHEYGGAVSARTARGKEVGFLETAMVSHDHVMMVTELGVDKSHRRRGLATKMYEIAASESCVRGRPLASGLSRSDEANAFWRKQEAKGRATRRHAEGEDYYVLSCPPPASLAGVRRWRRRQLGAPVEIEPAIQAEERELVRWATERGALIDHDGRVLQRWKGTKTRIRIPLEDKARFPDRIFTHSHPPTTFLYSRNDPLRSFKSGASLSPQDGYMAAALNLAEMRVVTKVRVNGQQRTVVYRITRPPGGWPDADRIKDHVDMVARSHRFVLQNKLRRREVEYEDVATAAADLAWREVAPKLGIKYDSVMLDGASSGTNWWAIAGIALLVLIPFVPPL